MVGLLDTLDIKPEIEEKLERLARVITDEGLAGVLINTQPTLPGCGRETMALTPAVKLAWARCSCAGWTKVCSLRPHRTKAADDRTT